MIHLWRGFHSPELADLVGEVWRKDQLLILCAPYIKDFNFIESLPLDQIRLWGEWDENSQKAVSVSLRSKEKRESYPEKPVLGVFTTGTTNGSPRLILYSKENIVFSLEAIRSVFDVNKIDRIFCYPQPTHAFGLILGYVQSFLYKLELFTGTGKYSKTFHELWHETESTKALTLGTPTHFEDLMANMKSNRHRPRGSYSCIVGGSRVSVNHWSRLQNELLISAPSIGYGATEATLGVIHHRPGLKPIEDDEVGFILPNVQLLLIEGRGVELSGPSVCVAIIQDGKIQFPKTVLIRDELEERSSDGVFLYRGRFELVLNRGGFKFSLEHIEQTLQQYLNTQVVCVTVPDTRLGEELGIVSVQAKKERVYEVLHNVFGQSFNGKNFIQVDEFPMNNNSKVDRRKCAILFQEKING